MHRLKKGHVDPGALVMNLTRIMVENDCIWGQSDYSKLLCTKKLVKGNAKSIQKCNMVFDRLLTTYGRLKLPG